MTIGWIDFSIIPISCNHMHIIASDTYMYVGVGGEGGCAYAIYAL